MGIGVDYVKKLWNLWITTDMGVDADSSRQRRHLKCYLSHKFSITGCGELSKDTIIDTRMQLTTTPTSQPDSLPSVIEMIRLGEVTSQSLADWSTSGGHAKFQEDHRTKTNHRSLVKLYDSSTVQDPSLTSGVVLVQTIKKWSSF
ncbi:hypothetical protein DAPPUDRAFT_316011 [Daphnia pulex]|uniref:Uncharacterized protein n=1 Tax=Daphnia pulex TaxID=6669 RepID=E9GBF8_DAPPU|nr:hypothetical protein DAPPUDRAFT_316011 [Daphnia pulex]|eukprot:EFX82950.1 hypothetical protein DAPPUDRAFT_316011 [Daphnia pulex]